MSLTIIGGELGHLWVDTSRPLLTVVKHETTTVLLNVTVHEHAALPSSRPVSPNSPAGPRPTLRLGLIFPHSLHSSIWITQMMSACVPDEQGRWGGLSGLEGTKCSYVASMNSPGTGVEIWARSRCPHKCESSKCRKVQTKANEETQQHRPAQMAPKTNAGGGGQRPKSKQRGTASLIGLSLGLFGRLPIRPLTIRL